MMKMWLCQFEIITLLCCCFYYHIGVSLSTVFFVQTIRNVGIYSGWAMLVCYVMSPETRLRWVWISSHACGCAHACVSICAAVRAHTCAPCMPPCTIAFKRAFVNSAFQRRAEEQRQAVCAHEWGDEHVRVRASSDHVALTPILSLILPSSYYRNPCI